MDDNKEYRGIEAIAERFGKSVDTIRRWIDDKLSRIARGDDAGEDTVLDLIGYLVLLRVLHRAVDKNAV